MSISSTLHFVAATNPSWQPDADFLRKLCGYIGGGTVWVFHVFARALDWEVDEDEENESIFDLHDVPVDQVLDEITKYRSLPCETHHAVYWFSLYSNEWREAFCEPFLTITDDVRGDFQPWDFGIIIGPERLTHNYTEEEFGTYAFQLWISGNSNAYGEDTYVQQALALEPVKKLKAFLEQESCETFGLIMTMS